MNSELVCVVANLGYFDGDDYFKGADCLESLKDLVRFLRKEDDSCDIRRQLGHSQVLQKDLLPLLVSETEDKELIDIVIRLLVNLTSPADICFNKKPEEAEEVLGKQKFTSSYQTKFLEVVSYLQSYKEAFTEEKVLAAIASHLGTILQLEFEDRGEDEILMFERLLLLLRNILHVPSNPNEEKRTEDDVSVHDQVLWNIHMNGIDDLLIYITSSPDEIRWSMHALEIVSLMLKEQNPEKLALASNTNDKTENVRALLVAKEKEEALRKQSSKKLSNTRHSRFGGSFWVMNLKGIGKKTTLVHHKHVTTVDDISFDHNKYPAKVSKRKQAAKETGVERSSTLSIRLFLKEFCVKFLEYCYNPLMRVVKNNIVAKRMQENDETYYLWAVRFFMAFNRAHLFKVEYVSETLNMNMFHYVLKEINNYFDQFFLHKRGGWEPWQKRLHSAIQTYKELLTYILNMDRSQDSLLKDASSIIKNNVFYHEEYRNIFLVLLRNFVANKQTKKYLADLAETFHVFLKLLEKFCGEKGTVLTQTKKKVKRHKKSLATQKQNSLTNDQLQELWENELAPRLSAILQGNEELAENSESVFNPASETPIEEQSYAATIRIQDHLRAGKMEGVALLRASREVWPDEEAFGPQTMNPEDEFMVVRNLLFKDLDRGPAAENEQSEDELNDEEEEEEFLNERAVEREFYLNSFLTSLATHQVIRPYCFLLKNFHSNSQSTNHAVIKMMHRIAVDLKLRELFFQLSTFITFKKILEEPSAQYKELADFAKYIINKFIETAQSNPNIFLEVLFWKGSGDCYQISEREEEENRNGAKIREKWTFEEEEELKEIYYQFKESNDVVEEVLKNDKFKDRTRRQIVNKMVRLHLVESAKELPKEKKVKQPKWTEEQSEELLRMFEEFKETNDPVGNIMAALTFPKSKNMIIKHLIEKGKITERKDLYKQRKSKKHFTDFMNTANHDNNNDSSSDTEEHVNKRTIYFDKIKTSLNNEAGSEDSPYIGDKVTKLCHQLKQQGYSQQIIWLQTRLKRVAEGREEDGDWYPVPLLTLTESDEKALSCEDFQYLLRAIGLKPPADEQEAFWRVPETLSPTILRRFADDLDKEYVVNSESKVLENESCQNAKDPSEIKISKAVKREYAPSESEDDNYEEYIKMNRKTKRNRIIEEPSCSEDENDEASLFSSDRLKNSSMTRDTKEEEEFEKIDSSVKVRSVSESSELCDYSALDFSLRVSEGED